MDSRSGAVVDGIRTRVFYNARDADDNSVLRVMSYNQSTGKGEGSQEFVIGDQVIKGSEGPIAACNIDAGTRLYVINDKTIVEYGKDGDADWKKETFTSTPIKLAQKSNLDALGVEYKGQKYKGEDIVIRIFYVEESAGGQVTMNTYTRPSGWRAEKMRA